VRLIITERPFGVEIEVHHLFYGYFLPIDSGVLPSYRIPDGLKKAFEEAGLPMGNREDTWRLEEDHSIRGRGAVEVVSPRLRGLEGLRDVEKAIKIVKDQEAIVNGTCGFHVHHDASDFGGSELRNLLKLMELWEPRIFQAIPNNEKRMERACRPLSPKLLELVNTCCDEEGEDIQRLKGMWYAQEKNSPDKVQYNETRYHGLNLHSYWFRGTAEFRYMRGTLVSEIAKSWVVFTHALMEAAKKGFIQAGDTEKALSPYFERWRKNLVFLET